MKRSQGEQPLPDDSITAMLDERLGRLVAPAATPLSMVTPGLSYIARGLTSNQMKFLVGRFLTGDIPGILDELGVTENEYIKLWKKDPHFNEAERLFEDGQGLTLAKLMYQQLAPASAVTSLELLGATKYDGSPDYQTRAKGVELIQKGSGLTRDPDTAPAAQFNIGILTSIKNYFQSREPSEERPETVIDAG